MRKLKNFPFRYRVLILLFFLILLTYLDRVCISLVGVRIKGAFHLSNEQFGWALGAFALAYAIFEIPSGVLGDRIGQRSLFLRIVFLWSLFTALTGFATGLVSLLAIRFLFGMGEAGAYPNTSAAIGRWFPVSETGRSMSILFVGQNAGAAIAPLLVVPVAERFGWRMPFFLNGFIGLIWLVICWRWFRTDPVDMKKISKDETDYILKNRRYIKTTQPFPWSKALNNWRIWAMLTAFFCSQWALYFFVAWLPVYLQQGRHLAVNAMKTTTSFLFVFGMAGAFLSGIVNDWLVREKGLAFARRSVGVLSLAMSGICLLLAAYTTNNEILTASLWSGNLFFAFFPITAFSLCVDIGGCKAGTLAGMMNFAGQSGAFILSLVFGKIADTAHNYNTPVMLIGMVMVSGGIFWMAVDPSQKLDMASTIVRLDPVR